MVESKPTRSGELVKKRNVIVVGGGIAGISTAIFLLDDGHHVTLFETGQPDKGTSSGNAGVISVASCVPTATPRTIANVPSMLLNPHGPLMIRWRYLPKLMPWLSRLVLNATPNHVQRNARRKAGLLAHASENYEQLLSITGLSGLTHQPGLLTVFETERGWQQAQWILKLLSDIGREVEILNSNEIGQVEHGLKPIFQHAFLTPDSGHILDPNKLMLGLHEAFLARGGVRTSERVLGITRSDPKCVTVSSANGEYTAERMVIAAGAWSKKLLATIGIKVPLESERGYHVMLPTPEPGLSHPINVFEESMFLSPMFTGLRLTSGVELASTDAPPDFTRVRRMIPRALRAVKGLHPDECQIWMGCRPSMPDSVPRLGNIIGHENIFVGFGGGHVGMTLGPTIGRINADLISGREIGFNLNTYKLQ